MLLGVISDTHGLLRPEALQALREVKLIIHAGDVGAPEILVQLKKIAPVFAVRGNVDTEAWARELPETAVLQVAGQAGPVQVPGAKRAIAHGSHGFAQQGNVAVVLEGV